MIIGIFFSPLLFEGKTLFSRDITVLAYPMKYFIFKAYHEGFVPFWNPSVYNGKPFLAEMFPGVFYPFNLIFFLSDFTTAFNWFYILQYVLLGISAYALTRNLRLSAGAAFCSAMTALLGGFFLSLPATTTPFYSAVWLPSIFYWARRFLLEKKIAYFLGAVICLACQILAGSPEFSILTVLTLFFWLLTQDPSVGWRRRFLRQGLVVTAMVALSCGMTAVQLAPTFFLTKESMRGGGLDFIDHAFWSMQPWDLTTLLVPKNYTGFMKGWYEEAFSLFQSLYMGLFAIFFLCAGFLYLKRKEVRFWIVVFLVGIFFALGKYNPLYRWFFECFPLIKVFRFPEKFYLVSAFSQVFLVGYGVDALVKSKPRTYFWLIPLLGLGLVYIALEMPWRNTIPSFVYLAVFGVAYALFIYGNWSARRVKSVLCVLIFLDLMLNDYMLLPMIDKSFYEDEPKIARTIKEDGAFFRVYSGRIEGSLLKGDMPGTILERNIGYKERLIPDIGIVHGISYADGIAGWSLESGDQWFWTDIFYKSPPEKRLRMLQRSNVKYWIKGEGAPEMEKMIFTPSKLEVMEGALPRAFLVPRARTERDPQLLNTYYNELFDPRREAPIRQSSKLARTERVSSCFWTLGFPAGR